MHSAERRHDLRAEKIASKAPVVRHTNLPRPGRFSDAHVLELKLVGRAVMLPSGTMFATTVSNEEGVTIWDTSPKPVRRHVLEVGVVDWTSMAAIGDDLLITANDEGDVKTWRVSSGQEIESFSIGNRKCDALVTCGGLVVLVDNCGRFVLLKHAPDGSSIRRLCSFNAKRSEEGFFLKANGNVFVSSGPWSITVYDAVRQRLIARLPIPEPDARGYYYTDVDRFHLVCARGVRVHIHTREAHLPLRRVVELPNSDITAVKLLDRDRLLVADSEDGGGTLALVSISTGAVLQRLLLPFKEVYSIDVTADARLVVASYHETDGVAVLNPPPGTDIQRDIELYARVHYAKKFVRRKQQIRKRKRGIRLAIAVMVIGTVAKLFTAQ